MSIFFLSHSLTHTHTLTHTFSPSPSPSLSLSHSLSLSLTHILTHTFSLSLSDLSVTAVLESGPRTLPDSFPLSKQFISLLKKLENEFYFTVNTVINPNYYYCCLFYFIVLEAFTLCIISEISWLFCIIMHYY